MRLSLNIHRKYTTVLTVNERAIFTANQFRTVQNNSLNRHKIGDYHGCCSETYDVQSTSSASSNVSCVRNVVQTEGMKDFLVWPDTPQRKGKDRWKDNHMPEHQEDTKRSLRRRNLPNVEQRKKKKQENEKVKKKGKKDKLVPAVTTVK